MRQPRYVVMVEDREPFAVAPDAESQRALWVLIQRCTGIKRSAAKSLLDDGKMICGGKNLGTPFRGQKVRKEPSLGDLMVMREDALDPPRRKRA